MQVGLKLTEKNEEVSLLLEVVGTAAERGRGSNLLDSVVKGHGHGWQSSVIPSVASP